MNILICTNFFYPFVGGGEIVSLNIAKYLAKEHQVTVLTRKTSLRREKIYQGISIVEHAGDPNIVKQIMTSRKIDVVFIYSDLFDFTRYILGNVRDKKIILATCGSNWALQTGFNGHLFSRWVGNIDRLICHSTVDRDYQLCSRVAPQKTVVIPNGVHLDEFDNSLSRNDLCPEHAEKIWVVNVSNFFPGKGQEHIVPILSRLKTDKPIAYIQIFQDRFAVGHALEQRWSQSRHDRIAIVPQKNIPRNKVIGFLKQSNAFLFTSQKEVAPLVLLEAMAARLPWVSGNVGNASELDGGVVITVPKTNEDVAVFSDRVYDLFAAALDKVLISPELGDEGRAMVEQRFNWETILPEYATAIATG